MKETTPAANPPCFERWCKRFDDCFKTKAQKRGYRNYLGGLLGESNRKNLTQIAQNTVGVEYNRIHHYITAAPWEHETVNQRRLEVMQRCGQTRVKRGFTLIIDDTGHRKSGNFTAGVGRQYIGEIGKTDNGVVTVTTHLWDGSKHLPLDIALYQKADSLPEGKEDPGFKKKPTLALDLIDQSLSRGYRPGIVVMDAGYGNNGKFTQAIEDRGLRYLGAVYRNRKVLLPDASSNKETQRLDRIAASLSPEEFHKVTLPSQQPKTVWVAVFTARLAHPVAPKTFAIVMNASSFEQATDVDYLMTNVDAAIATADWFAQTYSTRNWVEVFYREVKGWLGWREYQIRDKRSVLRHFVLVFCAYTFILWHKLTGGLRRQWATKPLRTFPEALEAFRTAVSFRFTRWLSTHSDLFAAYKASFGFVWA